MFLVPCMSGVMPPKPMLATWPVSAGLPTDAFSRCLTVYSAAKGCRVGPCSRGLGEECFISSTRLLLPNPQQRLQKFQTLGGRLWISGGRRSSQEGLMHCRVLWAVYWNWFLFWTEGQNQGLYLNNAHLIPFLQGEVIC